MLNFRRLGNPFPLPATRIELRQREAEAVATLRKAWRWSDGSARQFLLTLQADETAVLDWVALEAAACAQGSDTVIVALVSKEYLRVGINWAWHMRRLALTNAILICADRESHEFFLSKKMVSIPTHLPASNGAVSRAGFTPKGLMITSLKFAVCRRLLHLGYHVVFSDIDAYWLRDPIPLLKETQADLAYQLVYRFPPPLVKAWGHAACSGFFFLRAGSEENLTFLKACESEQSRIQDDQVVMNVALAEQAIVWRYPETECRHRLGFLRSRKIFGIFQAAIALVMNPFRRPWEVHGITKPIFGQSETTGLKVAAMPQTIFRRHLHLDISIEEAWVLHPNSPKDEECKLEVFRRLGVRTLHASELEAHPEWPRRMEW